MDYVHTIVLVILYVYMGIMEFLGIFKLITFKLSSHNIYVYNMIINVHTVDSKQKDTSSQ